MSTIPTPESDRTLTVEFLFDTEGACIGSFNYINRFGGLRIGDSIVKVVSASRALPRDKDDIYPDNSAESTPVYPRQQIISEEWTTDVNSPAFVIDKYDRIFDHSKNSWGFQFYEHPIALAPTEELINEILLIRQGKWIPLEGDEYCQYCNACECVHRGMDSGNWMSGQMTVSHYNYFPSIKQRDEWISKNKPVDAEIAELKRDHTLDGLPFVGEGEPLVRLYDKGMRHPAPPQIAQDEQTQPSPYSDESWRTKGLRIATANRDGSFGSISVLELVHMVSTVNSGALAKMAAPMPERKRGDDA